MGKGWKRRKGAGKGIWYNTGNKVVTKVHTSWLSASG